MKGAKTLISLEGLRRLLQPDSRVKGNIYRGNLFPRGRVLATNVGSCVRVTGVVRLMGRPTYVEGRMS